MIKRINLKSVMIAPKSEWEANDPVLSIGNLMMEKGTTKSKLSDGVHKWSELHYFTGEEGGDAIDADALNFSHGTHEEQQKKIDLIKKVRQELDLPIAVLLDTKGPEYRIRTFKNGKVHVNAGDKFTFTVDEVEEIGRASCRERV